MAYMDTKTYTGTTAYTRTINRISDKIIHITITPGESAGGEPIIGENTDFSYNGIQVLLEKNVSFREKDIYKFVVDGEPVIKKKKTANGEVSYIENSREIFERKSYSAVLEFRVGKNEKLLGLGQYEDGLFDYRNRREYLYESNMRIAIPFLVTTGHYGIFVESESNMIFESEDDIIRFSIDTADEISYYVFLGEDIDELISLYQSVTGEASMLPRWVFGYIQSKERYNSSDEILEILREFKERRIPLDCIVQDWYSWNEGLWGQKTFDKERYPDLKGLVDELHDENVHYMVSVWPNMSPDSDNYREFKEAGMLMDNSNLYDAFDEKARQLYFDQCRREILDSGSDALWCDNAEPFSDADWSGESKRPEELRYDLVVGDSKRSMPWEKINSYGLYHAKGIYENWRKAYPEKRVVNLTRSGYSSCQKYGTILWSGDITAKWSTLKKQITEGLKMGLSGMPYWTLDIGGFFVVKDKYENRGCNNTSTSPLWFWDGDYNEGVKDPEYCELYTRWLQFGTFLPVFRSHGTDTPREPWQFGYKYCNIITEYIRLRYRLMPYIYSLAYKAHTDAYIIMRSFVFDFAKDERALEVSDEYMFGPSMLIAPVTKKQDEDRESKFRRVYLPRTKDKGNIWYDFWNNKAYEGGGDYDIFAPIGVIPVFVKGGSIIPYSKNQMYADELNGDIDELRVYAGADCSFDIYNDNGDGYEFEGGEMCLIHTEYCEETGELTIFDKKGNMDTPSIDKVSYIKRDGSVLKYQISYKGSKLTIKL